MEALSMKRPEAKPHDVISKELNEFFLEQSSIDESLDNEDTMQTNPASSPYYPANQDSDFNFESYLSPVKP
jgi:hypothetical protein